MISVVIAIHLMLVLGMIGVVLLQKSEGGGLVSSSSGFLSNRGTANVLTRATALLAAGFFVTSIALSLLAGHQRSPASLINTGGGGGPTQQTSSPTAPLNNGNGGVLNQLGGGNGPANTTTGPGPGPTGPQVPQSK